MWKAHLSWPSLSDLGNSFVFPHLTTDPIVPADDYSNSEVHIYFGGLRNIIDSVYIMPFAILTETKMLQ